MRLSDKNIEGLLKAAQDNDPTGIGYGDVLLLCDEIQKRRNSNENASTSLQADRLIERLHEGHEIGDHQVEALRKYLPVAPSSEPPTVVLMDMLLERIQNKEALLDRQVLGVFNAMKKQGFFSTITFVNSEALETVLHAVEHISHLPHMIKELAATRNLPLAQGEKLNPIDQLVKDLNEGNRHAAT